MKNAKYRLASLLTVKSLVTLILTGVFAWMSVDGDISRDFMTIYAVIIAFYFGTQSARDAAGGNVSGGASEPDEGAGGTVSGETAGGIAPDAVTGGSSTGVGHGAPGAAPSPAALTGHAAPDAGYAVSGAGDKNAVTGGGGA